MDQDQYQYLKTGTFEFGSEWTYNGKTFDDFRDEFKKLYHEHNNGIVPEFNAEIICSPEGFKKARHQNAAYVAEIFQSHMNIWLSYSLAQLYLILEKKHAVDFSTVTHLDKKEIAKLIKENERKMLAEYHKIEKEYL